MAKRKKKFNPSDFMSAVQDAMGKDQVYLGTHFEYGEPVGWLSSSLVDLNELLDREGRGYPLGRILEVFGGSQSCKTALGYDAIAQAQKAGGIGILCASEGSFDSWLAEVYGINLEALIIVDDETGYFTTEGMFEHAFKVLDKIEGYDNPPPIVFVVDSIAALITKDDIKAIKKGEFDRGRSAQARALIMSQNLRRLAARIAKTSMLMFCINQTRAGKTTPQGMQGKDVSPGGYALEFFAGIRIRTSVLNKIHAQRKGKKVVAGFKIKLLSEKNRYAFPFQEAEMIVHVDKGLVSASEYGKKSSDKTTKTELPQPKSKSETLRRRRKKSK